MEFRGLAICFVGLLSGGCTDRATPARSAATVDSVSPATLSTTETPSELASGHTAEFDSAVVSARHRVIVSTDVGGTDPDDFQSLVQLLVYADVLEIEGLVSSPFGPGRKQDILKVIDLYECDYGNISTYSANYPTADALRSITKQGALEVAPYAGFSRSTEGSRWIAQSARRDDPRPLNLLVWGGIEDLAQALHDAPDILPKLRVYWIGGPNKKWSPDAYSYIAANHPELSIIESNATYRGWFVGGNQAGEWGNQAFVSAHVAGRGALRSFFTTQLGSTIKMGDSPSIGWLLYGDPSDPGSPSWGGRFVRARERKPAVFRRLTTKDDLVEEFGILELVLPAAPLTPATPEAQMVIENQSLVGFFDEAGHVHFRFSPKASKTYRYSLLSNQPSLDGKAGEITALPTTAQRSGQPLPNWWSDDPAPEFAEAGHVGVKTVSRFRESFLSDFAARIDRSRVPASGVVPQAAPSRCE